MKFKEAYKQMEEGGLCIVCPHCGHLLKISLDKGEDTFDLRY
ncbi:hypothetical protein LCGC14_1788370 [marine sediment metagenome]|uniref:Uncharacterized protein n=1 Tax=marine sediment metagenome TaxID=412755 RepID=A0A0F9HFV5_9ZZZZ